MAISEEETETKAKYPEQNIDYPTRLQNEVSTYINKSLTKTELIPVAVKHEIEHAAYEQEDSGTKKVNELRFTPQTDVG